MFICVEACSYWWAHVFMCVEDYVVDVGYLPRWYTILHIETMSFESWPLGWTTSWFALGILIAPLWTGITSGSPCPLTLTWFLGAKLSSRHTNYRDMPGTPKVFLWSMKSNKNTQESYHFWDIPHIYGQYIHNYIEFLTFLEIRRVKGLGTPVTATNGATPSVLMLCGHICAVKKVMSGILTTKERR